MDPLSISMSIITIIGATSSTIKAAKSVYKAPEELESLQNDLSDAELLIRDIKFYTEDQDAKDANPQEAVLQERLGDAESIVVQLKALVFEVLEDTDNPASVRRIAWLRAKKKTRKLRKKLARIHEDLPRRHGQAEGSRITLGLRNISSVQIGMNSSLSRLEDRVNATSQSVSQLQEALVSSQNQQDQTISSVEDLRHDTTQRLQRLESAISTNNDLLLRLPEILNLQIQTRHQTSTLTSSTRSLIGSSGDRTSETTANSITSTIQSTYQSVMIQSRYQHPKACELSCQCRCHVRQSFDSPSFLSNLLGQIFIGYKGIPALAKRCTDERCKRDSQPKVYLTYFFPQWWIVDRMVMLLAQWTIARGPELLLRFPRRIGMNSPVFMLAESGNIEGLKSLFNSGKASPNDLNDENRDPIYYAFSFAKLDTVKFLIQAGADTQVEDVDGRTLEGRACMALFTGTQSPDWVQWATESFMSKRSQNFAFSKVHEVVLGLRYTSLEEEISTFPGGIDMQDTWGYTPLHWASARGNLEAVCKLLGAGADPNCRNKLEQTPLLLSTRHGKLDCAMHLLHHGTDPKLCDKNSWTALHYLCACIGHQPSKARILEYLDTLFHMGIDINGQTRNGESALLLSLQAPEEGGNIPLLWLLNHGADHKLKSSSGRTILHQAGDSGDLKSVQILRAAQFRDIDVHARYFDTGATAMDELLDPYRYIPASEELVESFKVLLAEIEARTNGQIPHEHRVRSTSKEVGEEDKGKELTVLLDIHPSISEASLDSTKAAGIFDEESFPLSEDSEDEDEFIFYDSVEVQIPRSK